MSHMVIYRGADGKPGYHQADEIHDAISFVESLRNEQGVEHARIFRMEEVRFEYRPYFRVEIAGAGESAPAEAPAQPAVSPSSSAPSAPVVTAPETPAVSAPSTPTESSSPSSVATAAEEAGTAAAADAEAGDNGIGARRGLFGR